MTAPTLVLAIPLLAGTLIGASLGEILPFSAVALLLSWLACGVTTCARSAPSASSGPRETRVLRDVAAIAVGTGCLSAGVLLGAAAHQATTRPSLLAWYDRSPHDRSTHVIGVARDDAARTTSAVSLTVDVVEIDGRRVTGG